MSSGKIWNSQTQVLSIVLNFVQRTAAEFMYKLAFTSLVNDLSLHSFYNTNSNYTDNLMLWQIFAQTSYDKKKFSPCRRRR